MKRRRSVTFSHNGHRFEFGPWWFRWWLLLTTSGKAHHVITGEPCVLYRGSQEKVKGEE